MLNGVSLTLSDGRTLTLSNANFSITDRDHVSFTYTVSSVSGGFFQFSDAAGAPITTFASAQISANRVQFVANGRGTPPAFEVSVTDGEFSSGPVSAIIRFSSGDTGIGSGGGLPVNRTSNGGVRECEYGVQGACGVAG